MLEWLDRTSFCSQNYLRIGQDSPSDRRLLRLMWHVSCSVHSANDAGHHPYTRGQETNTVASKPISLHSSCTLRLKPSVRRQPRSLCSTLSNASPLLKARLHLFPFGLSNSIFLSDPKTSTISLITGPEHTPYLRINITLGLSTWITLEQTKPNRHFCLTMGVEKIMLRRGNGVDIPKKHDEVSMEYTGSSSNPIAQTQSSTFMQDGFTTTMRQTTKASSESDLFFDLLKFFQRLFFM